MLRLAREIERRGLAATIVAVGLGSGFFVGCGAPADVVLQPSPTVSSASPDPTESASPTPDAVSSSEPSPSETESPTEPSDDESERPPVLDEKATGRDLTLSDFFTVPDNWRDGRFDVAGERGLSGISGELTDCSADQDGHTTLELRLANRFKKISMNVGQSDDSRQSDAVLNVRLLGNGKYIDSVKVPFNKIDKFSASVSDVNALKIEVWIGGDNCRAYVAVGAVLSALRLE